MGMLAFGIVLLVLGVVLAFTNLFGLAQLAAPLTGIGWVAIAIGIVLAILSFLAPRRGAVGEDVVVERRYRRPL